MIVRIEASGSSFLGAGKYYLHDKLDAERAARADIGERIGMPGQSDERVWFTDTRNCLNTDPERAFEEMWHTAEDQAQLKMQAGVARGGRRCEDPVKTISLSWHKDDQPSPEHMVDSADAFLKHMGWDNHQAVLVGHRDTEHRHIHIILNRIDPENGRTLDDFRERKRAQSWALAYEKEHAHVRCEERELRAAKREQRAPELNRDVAPLHTANGHHHAPSPDRTPANDHLPHNVIALTRPMQREFEGDEQARADEDALARAELKAEQRAEREAFYKDGVALFKATRHAVYDEVRKEYAPEWRQYYKDAEVARRDAAEWSRNSVTRAFYFAQGGDWAQARTAFNDKDSVHDAVETQMAERKTALKERQLEDLRERQKDALDALREIRDVQYQDLLVRQRYEREMLGSAAEPPTPANQNQTEAAQRPPIHQAKTENPKTPAVVRTPIEHGQEALFKDVLQATDKAISEERGTVLHPPLVPTEHAPSITRQLPDLAASGILAAADYLADQLGEMFAPTPPEVREAQAAEQAKLAAEQHAQQPSQDDKAAAYARMIDAAVKAIEAERAAGIDERFWKERDRGKDWERDR